MLGGVGGNKTDEEGLKAMDEMRGNILFGNFLAVKYFHREALTELLFFGGVVL